jgi:uncharacterized protein YjiS (DUF1127 family)
MRYTVPHTAVRMVCRLHAALQELRRWYRERRMISALQTLSDVDLKDIGVYRCEIAYIARMQCAAGRES